MVILRGLVSFNWDCWCIFNIHIHWYLFAVGKDESRKEIKLLCFYRVLGSGNFSGFLSLPCGPSTREIQFLVYSLCLLKF